MVRIEWPTCRWCKSSSKTVYRCKTCKDFTCNDCFVDINEQGRCVHRRHVPIVSTGWAIEYEEETLHCD